MSISNIQKKPFIQELDSYLECPISHNHMKDPVVLVHCGHTFDRPEITPWLEKKGHCPDCRKETSVKELVSNYKVKELSEGYANYQQGEEHLDNKAKELSITLFKGNADYIQACYDLFSLTTQQISSLSVDDQKIAKVCRAATELDPHDIYLKIQTMQTVPEALLERILAFKERADIRKNKEVMSFIGSMHRELNELREKLASKKIAIITTEKAERADKEAQQAKQETQQVREELKESKQEAKETKQELNKTKQELNESRQETQQVIQKLQQTDQELNQTKQEAKQANQRCQTLEGKIVNMEHAMVAIAGAAGFIASCAVTGPVLGATTKFAAAKALGGRAATTICAAKAQARWDFLTKLVNWLLQCWEAIVAFVAKLGFQQNQQVQVRGKLN